MTRRVIAAAAAVALGLSASAALGANEPIAFATATRGNLNVVSDVLLAAKSAEMRGVWFNEARSCFERRRLRVEVEIFYSRGGTTSSVQLAKTGWVGNCAEGGPNFGFVVRAARHGLACPNGRWKPGSYSFLTTAKDARSGLAASASLLWEKRGAC
jgi:hypothetical protein